MSRVYVAAPAAGITLALLWPAQAQFWDWGNRPQRQKQYNNWGGWGGGWFDRRYDDPYRQEREAPVDYSRAPPPSQKKPEATTPIVVVGDANADWLAYGLEDAFSENPEIAVVRKHRTDSSLIRYDQRRELEWPQVAREIIAAEKPKFIVMMIGNNDHQTIREKAPPAPRPGAPKPNTQATPATPATPSATTPMPPSDPEQQPPQPSEAAEPANMTPEQARRASDGPWEFHTEKWELAYIRRIDATIAALKSAGVPVMWVGLPSQRATKASADSSYLNELFRSRAERAGIVYVDIWDGFVDEAGRYSAQGPDYEGQTRRLRSADGVYFTKFGARKLAHYVEREIQRSIANRGVPVALPVPVDPGAQAPNANPGGPTQRPAAGPVVSLTAMNATAEELVGGGGRANPSAVDAIAWRVLSKGEPMAAPSGRADDFSWPRGSALKAQPPSPHVAAAPAAPDDASAATKPAPGRASASDSGPVNATSEQKPAAQRRPRRPNPYAQRPPSFFPIFFR